ncbi:MAG: hypothetical protein ACRESW_01620, partial [Nevskiales bacterium]
WTLLALGATFVVVLSVVCLLLYINLDTAPEYRPQFESMRISTLLFAGVMSAAAAAIWAHRQRHVLRWPAEMLLATSVTITVLYFLPK